MILPLWLVILLLVGTVPGVLIIVFIAIIFMDEFYRYKIKFYWRNRK